MFLRDSRADTKPAMNTQRWIPGERLVQRSKCGCCQHRAGSKQVEMKDMAKGNGQKLKGPELSIKSLHAEALRGDESEKDPEELRTLTLMQNQRAWCRRRQVSQAPGDRSVSGSREGPAGSLSSSEVSIRLPHSPLDPARRAHCGFAVVPGDGRGWGKELEVGMCTVCSRSFALNAQINRIVAQEKWGTECGFPAIVIAVCVGKGTRSSMFKG